MGTKKHFPILIAIMAIIKFMIPFVFIDSAYELQRDELLYFQQSQHPALGYLENPPLLSYLGIISSWFGGSESSIRFWPALFGSATLIITCLISREWGAGWFGQFLAGLAILTGAYLRIHVLYQPNILDIFFWTLSVYFIIRYIITKQIFFLYAFWLSLALAFWSKYSVVFFLAAILISFLITQHRNLFNKRNFYIGGLIALIFILPNIIWQYNHQWPVLHHMKELRESQLQHRDNMAFVMEQFLMTLPVLPVWIAGLIWLWKNKTWRFLFFTWIFVIVFLMLGSGKGYYALGAYPMLFAAGAVAWESWLKNKIYVRWVLPAFTIILTVFFFPLALPLWNPQKLGAFYKQSVFAKMGVLTWEDGMEHDLPMDFADMLGWKQTAIKTERFFNGLSDSVKNNTIIFGSHYGQAGALTYYASNNFFKSKVHAENGSFVLWVPDDLRFKNMILVSDEIPDFDVFNHFSKITKVDSVNNVFSRQHDDKIFFMESIDEEGLEMARNFLLGKKKSFIR